MLSGATSLETGDILDLFDHDERREVRYPGMRREVAPPVVRQTDPSGGGSAIIHSQLNQEETEGVIRREMDYFSQLGLDFEWKVFDYDQPEDLKSRLEKQGFEVEAAEAVLVLDLETRPGFLALPASSEMRRVTDSRTIHDLVSVQNAVWGGNHDWLARRLESDLKNAPEALSVYVAYEEDVPVSTAWIRFSTHGRFVSLWGGSTLPASRGKGFYTALVSVRLREAAQRGFRFATVDAQPTSQPILEKRGFKLLTRTHACHWRAPRA